MANLPSIRGTEVAKITNARILKTDFGDGYSQRALDGINAIVDEWSMSWVVNSTDADTLTDFFEARGGHESFDWTPEGESVSKKWTCKSWTKEPMTTILNVWSITATFKQEFDLS